MRMYKRRINYDAFVSMATVVWEDVSVDVLEDVSCEDVLVDILTNVSEDV